MANRPRRPTGQTLRAKSLPGLPETIANRMFDEPLTGEDALLNLFLKYPEPRDEIWNEKSLADLWEIGAAEVVEQWARKYPGTRPSLWWTFTAPEPCRQRLGGIGTPTQDILNGVPYFDYGLPISWITESDLQAYDIIGLELARPVRGAERG